MKMASVLTVVACASFAGFAAADFTGDYAPANWQFFTNQNGFVDLHDASTLVLVGPDDGSFTFGYSDLGITVPVGGSISFDWSYSSNDLPGFDAGFYFAGGFIFLSNTSGESGSISGVTVNAGDVFGFSVETQDSRFGPGVLTITNFNYIPAPGAALVLAGAGLMAGRRRRA